MGLNKRTVFSLLVLPLFFLLCFFRFCAAGEDNYSSSFFKLGGLVAFENFFSPEQGDNFKNANKKNELRLRLLMKLGGENLFLYAVPEIYLLSSVFGNDPDDDYSYEGNLEGKNYFRTSNRDSELILNECYFHYSMDNFQIRLGNQIISWGTADVFNPTSYFNPFDMRETFIKEPDCIKLGVPLLSGIAYFEDYTAELVWMPFHVTPDRAKKGEFWYVAPDNYSLPVELAEDEKHDSGSESFAYGLRITTTFYSMDMSLSCYHGPDNDPVYVPRKTAAQNGSPLAVLVAPEYYPVNKLGVDFAGQYKKMIFQFEAAYSPDRRAVIEQNLKNADSIKLPYDLVKTDCLSYSAGFNYFIPVADYIDHHEGELIFSCEWFSVNYFDDRVMEALLSDYLSIRLEDTFLDGHLQLKCTGLIDTRYKGSLLWPEIVYDFENGFSLEMAYVAFNGQKKPLNRMASIFHYLEDNNILSLKVQYEF